MAARPGRLMRVLLLLVAVAASTAGQTWEAGTVARATTVDWVGAVPTGTGVLLGVQCGRQVTLMSFAGGRPVVVAEAVMPPATCLWDWRPGGRFGELVVQSDRELRVVQLTDAADRKVVRSAPVAASGDLFRGRLSAAPLKRDLCATRGGAALVATPGMGGVDVVATGGDGITRTTLPLAATSEQSLGWGLGYRMVSRLTVPWFAFAHLDGDGALDVLALEGSRLLACDPGGSEKPREWGVAPPLADTSILGFDHLVPPLAHDFDRDGLVDLVLCEPGTGSVFVYRGRERASKPRDPDHAIKVSGYVLWRWFADQDGDGRSDLVLLTVPRLNIIDQVRIFRTGTLPARVSVRLQEVDGSLGRSAEFTERLGLPTVVSLTRNKRSVRFKAPCVPLPLKDGLALLAPSDEGLKLLARDDDGDWKRELPFPAVKGGESYLAAPFDPAVADLNGDGTPDVAVALKDSETNDERVVVFLSK